MCCLLGVVEEMLFLACVQWRLSLTILASGFSYPKLQLRYCCRQIHSNGVFGGENQNKAICEWLWCSAYHCHTKTHLAIKLFPCVILLHKLLKRLEPRKMFHVPAWTLVCSHPAIIHYLFSFSVLKMFEVVNNICAFVPVIHRMVIV